MNRSAAARIASAFWSAALSYDAPLNTVLLTELRFFSAGNFTVSLAHPPTDAAFPFTSGSALLVGGVVLWREWFLRYSAVPCISWPPGRASRTGVTAGGEADDGCYPVGSYDRAALDAARQGVS